MLSVWKELPSLPEKCWPEGRGGAQFSVVATKSDWARVDLQRRLLPASDSTFFQLFLVVVDNGVKTAARVFSVKLCLTASFFSSSTLLFFLANSSVGEKRVQTDSDLLPPGTFLADLIGLARPPKHTTTCRQSYPINYMFVEQIQKLKMPTFSHCSVCPLLSDQSRLFLAG